MGEWLLFVDGSVDPKSKIGVGASLWIRRSAFLNQAPSFWVSKIKTMQFNNTSSTRLELQTVLWALETLHPTNETITIYTDSQNIVGLPARRQRLEEKNYYSRKNIPLKNEDIYRRFYQMEEKINFQLVKLEGHKAVGKREKLDHVFALVDQASRDVVRRGR